MDLQSPTIGELAKALAQVQGRIKPIQKAGEVDVVLKTGGKKHYRFATLLDTWQSIRVACAEAGVAIVQLVQVMPMAEGQASPVLITTLMHASGEWVRSVCPIRVLGSDAQAFGSAITYARRYALTAAIGIVADDDDDGLQASGYPAPQWAQLPPPPPPPPPAPSGDWVSPPAVAAAEASAQLPPPPAPAQALPPPPPPPMREPGDDTEEELELELMARLHQATALDRVAEVADQAKRSLPAPRADRVVAQARTVWEQLSAPRAAA